jgi:hypothetical protein
LGGWVLLATSLVGLSIALPVGDRIILIGHYGWSRFRAESLSFVWKPKGHPWMVSNGDMIEVSFVYFLVTCALWGMTTIALWMLLVKLVGRGRFYQ